jgi:Na+/H+-dicarboxylate symporter
MFEIIIALLIGAFVGWHIPEPSWAKTIKEKIVSLFQKKEQ